MLKAIKDNKVYNINENQKKQYLSDGYDIHDEDGNVVEYSHLKTIKYTDHLAVVNELKTEIEKLKGGSETPLSKMKKEDLLVKAKELGLEISEEMKVDDIRELIKTEIEK